jgi:lipopolysaccharide transport system permease protein
MSDLLGASSVPGRSGDVHSRETWTVNRAPTRWLPSLDLGRLWRHRELAIILAERDLRVRYKQAALGVAWVVIQPLAAAALFSVVFGRLTHLGGDGVPYPIFAYSGLILWTYFASGLDGIANSLVRDRDLIAKIYFPRLLAPLATLFPGLVDVAVSLIVLAIAMAGYGVAPGLPLLLLPLWVLATVAVLLGAGLYLAALNVRYRDVRHTLAFGVQLWLFATPVAYPPSLIRGSWTYLAAANPMTTIVTGFRWSLVDSRAPGPEALVSLAVVVVLLAGGLLYFLRAERRFADVI